MYYIFSVPTCIPVIVEATRKEFKRACQTFNTVKQLTPNSRVSIKETADLTLIKRSEIYKNSEEVRRLLANMYFNDIFFYVGGDNMKIKQPTQNLT